MFNWRGKRNTVNGVVGMTISSDGVALARVTRKDHDAQPKLEICHYYTLESAQKRPELLTNISSEHNLEAAHCVSVAPSGSFNLLLIESPEVENSELRPAVRWRIKEMIDFHIDDSVIDVFDIDQAGRVRTKMMYVVASRINTVRDHIDMLEQHRVNLEVIDIPELAMRNISSLLNEDASGIALLHLGNEGSLLTLSRESNLYLSRNIETNLQDLLLNSVEHELNLEPSDAIPGVEPMSNSGISAALRSALDSMILEIQRSLDYYESHFSLPPASALVIAPMETPIPGLISYLADNLGISVRMLDLNTLFQESNTLPDALQARAFLAIGAALRQEEKAL